MKLKKDNITFLVIHHTATMKTRTTFNAVKNYHINVLKFGDIGYHFFIDANGRVYHGRPVTQVGAHCKTPGLSMNFRSLGIGLAGNFQTESPNIQQEQALNKLLDELIKTYNISKFRVKGHNEVPGTKTLCPGKNLLPFIKEYREKVEEVPEKKAEKVVEDILKVLRKHNII